MWIRTLRVALVPLTFAACATTSIEPLPTQPPEAPSCPLQSFLPCEGPNPETSNNLGETEPADAMNRARWLTCIERHNAWLQCAKTLIDRGFLRAPSPTAPATPQPATRTTEE